MFMTKRRRGECEVNYSVVNLMGAIFVWNTSAKLSSGSDSCCENRCSEIQVMSL